MSMPVSVSAPLPPRVAVLDDDQAFLALLRDVLTDAGYETHTLRTGSGAHDVLRTLAPAAIVLDLPAAADALGWRLLALLARDAHLRHIPLVACVPDDGHASARATALRPPVSTLVCKPFTLDGLLAALERLLDRHADAHVMSPHSHQAKK
jgi:DNA-binding response OmpR family regulator